MKYKIGKNFFIIFILGVFLFLSFIPFVNASSDIPPSVSEYAGKFNSESECENYAFAGKGNCYGFFASQKNDIDYCDKATDLEVVACITRFSIDNNNVDYCDTLEKENLKQKCMAKYYMFKNEISGCGKITDKFWKNRCLEALSIQRAHQISDYLFYISLAGLIVLILVLMSLKFSVLKILNVVACVLFPIIIFAVYAFKLSDLLEFNFDGIRGTLYSIILLIYGIFCFIVSTLDIKYSFKEMKNGNPDFKKIIKKTYCYIFLLSIFIATIQMMEQMAIGGGIIGNGSFVMVIMMLVKDVLFFWFVYSLTTFLILIGMVSVIYSIKSRLLKNKQYKFFTRITAIIGIILIIVGGLSALFFLSMAAAIG